jgi:hypothetical protein
MRILVASLVAAVWLAPGREPQAFDPSRYRVVDLTHAYGQDTIYWPAVVIDVAAKA